MLRLAFSTALLAAVIVSDSRAVWAFAVAWVLRGMLDAPLQLADAFLRRRWRA